MGVVAVVETCHDFILLYYSLDVPIGCHPLGVFTRDLGKQRMSHLLSALTLYGG